jgi:hypothetical protein
MTAAAMAFTQERQRADEVARRLVAEGYDVVIEPGLDDLPPDIARLRPDLLARRGDERVIVEVQPREPGGSARPRIEALAKAVGARPAWKFELVVVPEDRAAGPGQEWSPAEIRARVDEARKLAAAGHGEAALMLAWSACEAAARALALDEELEVQRWLPSAMFRQLVHAGLLDNGDLQTIEDAWIARNRLTHGLSGIGDPSVFALNVARVAEGLLHELESEKA